MSAVFLCGFMGCGKSTVGRRLAQRLGAQFVDLDAFIEERAGMAVAEIFERCGQAHFRALEHESLCALCGQSGVVVATGGGALTYEQNVRAIPEQDAVVFLDADFETCYARIRDSARPLVRGNTKEQLQRLFAQRRPAYKRAAAYIVDAGGGVELVAQRILSALPGTAC